jgi:hypothetical protein
MLILINFSLFVRKCIYVVSSLNQLSPNPCQFVILIFLVNRVASVWNSLPDSNVTVESVFSFKRRVNTFDFSEFRSLWLAMHFPFISFATVSFCLLFWFCHVSKETNNSYVTFGKKTCKVDVIM